MRKFVYGSIVFFIVLPFVVFGQNSGTNPKAQNLLNKSKHNFFIENKGQWPKEVRYMARIGGMNAWITDAGVVYDYYQIIRNFKPEEIAILPPGEKEEFERKHTGIKGHVINMMLEGANKEAKSIPSGMQEGYYNYFIGNDSTKWASFVRLYNEVIIKDVYKGIDIRYYFDNGLIRYDYIAKPGANLAQINLKTFGSYGCYVNTKGELSIKTSLGEMVHGKLFAYQIIGNNKTEIYCSFFKNGNGEIGVFAENYNPELALIIDPLVYSTFIGGSGDDQGYSIALDKSGNALITGTTVSTNYPTTPGAYDMSFNSTYTDMFITKLNNSGSSLIYSTFIGGSNNGNEGYSIAADVNGDVFVTGTTSSLDYPTTTGAYDVSQNGFFDAFVTKLNASGSALVYSTYIGGSSWDYAVSIAIDDNGNAFITGQTYSYDFPTTTGAYDITYNSGLYDAFITKLNAAGSALIYSTFIGGKYEDRGFSIGIDPSGNATITGWTYSDKSTTNFPSTAGAYDESFNGGIYDAFVTKFNASGSALVYSTYLGTSGQDVALSLAIDSIGNAYVAGYTASTAFPTTTGAYDKTYNGGTYDVFITKLNTLGTALIYSTFIGGSLSDVSSSIRIDKAGNAYITGYTTSTDYPCTLGSYDNTNNAGTYDAFVTKLNASCSALVYSTLIGGSTEEQAKAIVVDNSGNALITGFATSGYYPTTAGAYDSSYNGGYNDLFVTKVQLINQATNISFKNITGSKATCNWTKGSGFKRAVFIKQDSVGLVIPTANTTYSANSNFGYGSQVGTTGWYCVYNDTGSSVTITGLATYTKYRVMICEYIGSSGNELYNTDPVTNNPANFTTLNAPPTIQASNLNFSNITATGFSVSCLKGDGIKRAFFIKAASTGNAAPINTTTYSANTSFGSGSQIGTTGWYCVYNDTGRTVNISNLTTSTVYRVMVCEYNRTAGAELYNTSTSTNNPANQQTDFTAPTIQASNINFSNFTSTSVDYSFTRGNGTACLVLLTDGTIPFPPLIDNTTYTVSSQVGTSGWYCKYKGTLNSNILTGLYTASFNLMVCEYNGTPGKEKYNTDAATFNPKLLTFSDINDPRRAIITVYPIPTSGQLVIENAKGYHLTISNTLGETIYNNIITENPHTVDLNNATEGIYFLKLERNGNIISRKVVLRR